MKAESQGNFGDVISFYILLFEIIIRSREEHSKENFLEKV